MSNLKNCFMFHASCSMNFYAFKNIIRRYYRTQKRAN